MTYKLVKTSQKVDRADSSKKYIKQGKDFLQEYQTRQTRKKSLKGAHWRFLLKALSDAKRALGPSKKAPKRRNDFLRVCETK